MDIFKRWFAVDQLAQWHLNHPNSAVAVLFDRWVLPGRDAGSHGVRIGIRNGYLNLYVKGQSVAELRMVREEPRIDIHAKYVAAAHKGSDQARDLGQDYDCFVGEELTTHGADTVDNWVRTAESYAGEEKRFVDDLVAANPGTIDLEMALPADAGAAKKDRSAPRMDLVVAQGRAIAFWEAKCVTNPELRARAAYEEFDRDYVRGPHVVWQLRRYQNWVSQVRRLSEVRQAYVAGARHLLQLADLFGKTGPATEAWRTLSEAGESAAVILPPGVVVAEYCPMRAGGKDLGKTPRYEAKAKSFVDHKARLIRHGATVVVVQSKPSTPLPFLQQGVIDEKEQPG